MSLFCTLLTWRSCLSVLERPGLSSGLRFKSSSVICVSLIRPWEINLSALLKSHMSNTVPAWKSLSVHPSISFQHSWNPLLKPAFISSSLALNSHPLQFLLMSDAILES